MYFDQINDPVIKRKLLVNEVIERHCKYGEKYEEALAEFNKQFSVVDNKTRIAGIIPDQKEIIAN